MEHQMAKRNDASAKIDADVIGEAKIAAAILGLSLTEFLTLAAREKSEKVTAEYRSAGTAAKLSKTTPEKS